MTLRASLSDQIIGIVMSLAEDYLLIAGFLCGNGWSHRNCLIPVSFFFQPASFLREGLITRTVQNRAGTTEWPSDPVVDFLSAICVSQSYGAESRFIFDWSSSGIENLFTTRFQDVIVFSDQHRRYANHDIGFGSPASAWALIRERENPQSCRSTNFCKTIGG